jgi:hypothetical protein
MGIELQELKISIATGWSAGVCFPAESRNFLLATDPGQAHPVSSEIGTGGSLVGDKAAGT